MKKYRWFVIGGLIGLYILMSFYFAPYRIDDAYITYRYSANLAEGIGYVYNPGEWVEGASNLLWGLLLVPFYWLSFPMYGTSAWLGRVFWSVLIGYLTWFLSRRGGKTLWPSLLSVALCLIVIAPGPLWSISGLETSLFVLLLTVGAVTGNPYYLLTAALCRPEGIAFLLLIPLLNNQIPVKKLVSSLVFYSLVLATRLSLYGDPLPFSVTAKAGPLYESFVQGVRYLNFGIINHIGIVTVGLGVGGVLLMRQSALKRRILATLILQLTVVFTAGGDWMPYSRLIVPCMPFLAIGTHELLRTKWRYYPTGLILIAMIFHLQFLPEVYSYTRHLSKSVRDNRIVARRINQTFDSSDTTIALTDLGAFGWELRDWRVIDRVGLVTREIGAKGRGLYKNYDPDFVLSKEPELIQTHLSSSVPKKLTRVYKGIKFYRISSGENSLKKHATWAGGEALYASTRFHNEYRFLFSFRTPGNPINVFWVRRGIKKRSHPLRLTAVKILHEE